ncbi:MAG: rhomboid family intramembrane serine protease [Deltaproteobacteria bacterium]|nr:rhomboid family intramembrane serine protease [Deltaproteobacteria bacterium]
MIPLRSSQRSSSYPIVNNTLIGINVVFFLIELGQGQRLNEFIYTYGLIPARYFIPQISAHFTLGEQLLSFLSFMFLHGGFLHLLSNMWSLYIFGANVEDKIGPIRYLLFYLLCGLASGIAHIISDPSSQVPTIGASGAIAGIMGAYFILFPKSKILTLIPFFFFFHFVEIPAYFFLGIWFLIQFLSATASSGQIGGIAWWAHIGGFVFGIIFLKLFALMPEIGASSKIQKMTKKRTTSRIQVIRPITMDNDPNSYGNISITTREAFFGTRKLINIPVGFKKRTFFVTIPPNIAPGDKLRLRGLGRILEGNTRGDLYLKVNVMD